MSKYSDNIPPSILGAIGWFYDDIKENTTFLDFGCSTGYYGAYIKEHKNCKVYGVEISDDKKEAEKVLDGVYSFDIDADWPKAIYERKYDAVFFGDVIEHLKDPELALKKTIKLLKFGGCVFISTPNVAHMSVRLELMGGGFEYESMGILDNTHLKYFTLSTLQRICASAGYDIDRIDSSLSDYPRGLIRTLLEKYGLEPHEKFWKLASDATARTFQYKLILKPTKKGAKKQPQANPLQKPEQFKVDYIEDMNAELARRQQRIDELVKFLENTNEQHIKVITELQSIKESRAYLLVKKIVKIKKSNRRK